MADVNLGVLASTTLDNYHDSLVDNIFKKHVLMDHLKQNGGTKTYDGGRKLVAPLMYGTNSTVQTFSGLDELDNTYQDGIDASEWDWKYYNVSITFSLEEKSKNRGKHAVINLLKAKIKQAEMAISEKINTDLISGSDAKGIVGLDTIIGTTTEVGEISGTTYSWWRSTVEATGETLSFARVRTAKNTANNGNGGSNVSLILTTQTLYEKMFALLTATYQFNPVVTRETKRLADASFQVLEFEGVPVSYEESATTGVVYFINKDNYKLGILDGYNFVNIDKGQPVNQHVDIAHIVFGGAAYTDRRASLAKLTGKTA
jgi:hypothetical protein